VAKRLKRRGDTDVLTFEKTEVIDEKTGVISEKTGVITEETPVIDGNNPTKKRKEKENKEKTKKENFGVINFKLGKTYGSKSQQLSSTDEDTERQAELDRMRQAAIANQ
jgi:hypothetical protein